MRTIQKLLTAGVIAAGLVACSDSARVVDHDPAALLMVAGDGQFGLPGGALPESLVVQVVEAQSTGVAGVAVSWTVTGGGGTVAPATATSDGNGRVAARWTLGALGANQVSVSAAGFGVSFGATATNTPPTQLALVTEPAGAVSGFAFTTQPVVEIQTLGGVPVPQAGVTVSAVKASGNGFGSLSGTAVAVTNANGRATFSGLKLTGPVGDYTLRFSAPGLASATSAAITLSTASGRVPLTDMGSLLYLGQYSGGLYANGSNAMPAAHAAEGAARARAIKRLDLNGNPSASGKIILMSIGISNATQEWCDVPSFPCNSWSFTGQAAADNQVNHSAVAVLNGARGSQTASEWDSPTDWNYDRIRDSILDVFGYSEAQVQVIWAKTLNADPTTSLPSPQADAITLVTQYGDILRALKTRYPNLQMVFMASRSYGGYAVTQQNPEPFAYEVGYGVKWVIQAQIDQMANGGSVVDARAGNLNYNTVAPWVAWGAYFWADGLNPRSDGLTWARSDFESDGTHPDVPGETKIGTMLLNFFKSDPRTGCWFKTGQTCP
jgi:hypothetical protein